MHVLFYIKYLRNALFMYSSPIYTIKSHKNVYIKFKERANAYNDLSQNNYIYIQNTHNSIVCINCFSSIYLIIYSFDHLLIYKYLIN